MIIDKPEALKQWMSDILRPMCDAEPVKLAKYVLALIKKDMPQEQLRLSMVNNLDIFLHDKTTVFVEQLFAALEDKCYLSRASPDATAVAAPVASAPPAVAKPAPLMPQLDPTPVAADPSKSHQPQHRRRDRRPSPRDRGAGRAGGRRSWGDDKRRRSPPPRDRRARRQRSRSPVSRGKLRSRSRTRSRSPPQSSTAPAKNKSKSPVRVVRSYGSGSDTNSTAPAEDTNGVNDLRNKLNSQTAAKQRCADFDEKGYCMRGDQCPYDHGLDPVVLKDVTLPDMLKYGPHTAAAAAAAAAVTAGTGGTTAAAALLTAVPPPPFNPLVQPPAIQPTAVNTEGYNPDAPSLTAAAAWAPPSAVTATSYVQQPPPESVPVALPPSLPPSAAALMPSTREVQVTMPIHRPLLNTAVPPPAIPTATKRVVWAGGDFPARKRGHFDFGRLGGGSVRPRFNPANCSLELRKVPPGLNQITHLNKHFSKFGAITNIQVSFQGDPAAAMVTFSNPAEAKAAYKSTEAVLNNRFIKVFWHNKERSEAIEEELSQTVGHGTVKERLGDASAEDGAETTANAGVLTRTVTNEQAVRDKTVSKQADIDAIQRNQKMLAAKLSLHNTSKQKQKQAQKLSVDLQKRKSELLEKQLSQQKALFARLENRDLSKQERETLMKTVKALQEAIVQTRAAALADVPSGPQRRPQQLPAAAKRPPPQLAVVKSKEAAEKEMLDMEMELYQRQQTGADTTGLSRRVAELQSQLMTMSSVRGRGRPPRRGRGRGRGMYMSSAAVRKVTRVDRRPTRLLVQGHKPEEMSALMTHLARFGEIVLSTEDATVASVRVTYATRQQAEVALLKARSFHGRQLTVSWDLDKPAAANPSLAAVDQQLQPSETSEHLPESGYEDQVLVEHDEESVLSELADDLVKPDDVEEPDEDDDEGEQERSWRR